MFNKSDEEQLGFAVSKGRAIKEMDQEG